MSDDKFFKSLSQKIEQDLPSNLEERMTREIEKRSKSSFSFMMPAAIAACLAIVILSGVMFQTNKKEISFDNMELAMQQELLEDLELFVVNDSTEDIELLELSDEEWDILLEGENV